MVDIRIAQPAHSVKTDTPQRLIWRKPIVGGLVECTLVRDDEGGGYVRVQVDGESHVRSIHVTDIVSWIVETPPATPPAPKLDGMGDVLMAMALQALVNVGEDASDYYHYFTPGFVEASAQHLTRHQDAVGESRAQYHVAVIFGLPSFSWKAV